MSINLSNFGFSVKSISTEETTVADEVKVASDLIVGDNKIVLDSDGSIVCNSVASDSLESKSATITDFKDNTTDHLIYAQHATGLLDMVSIGDNLTFTASTLSAPRMTGTANTATYFDSDGKMASNSNIQMTSAGILTATQKLAITGTNALATDGFASLSVLPYIEFGSGTIDSRYGSMFGPNVKITSGLLTNWYNSYFSSNIFGGSSITNAYQIYVSPILSIAGSPTVDNAYSIYSRSPSVGTNKYNLYLNGSGSNSYCDAVGDWTIGGSMLVSSNKSSTTGLTMSGFSIQPSFNYSTTPTTAAYGCYISPTVVSSSLLTDFYGTYIKPIVGSSPGQNYTSIHGLYIDSVATGGSAPNLTNVCSLHVKYPNLNATNAYTALFEGSTYTSYIDKIGNVNLGGLLTINPTKTTTTGGTLYGVKNLTNFSISTSDATSMYGFYNNPTCVINGGKELNAYYGLYSSPAITAAASQVYKNIYNGYFDSGTVAGPSITCEKAYSMYVKYPTTIGSNGSYTAYFDGNKYDSYFNRDGELILGCPLLEQSAQTSTTGGTLYGRKNTSTFTFTISDATAAYGDYVVPTFTAGNSRTITDVYGIYAQSNLGTITDPTIVTNLYGAYIDGSNYSGSAPTVANTCSLYVRYPAITGGTSTNTAYFKCATADSKIDRVGDWTIGGNITNSALTADRLVYSDSSKVLKSATLGTSLSLSSGTLNTSQAITTSSSPTFVDLTLTGKAGITGIITAGNGKAEFNSSGNQTLTTSNDTVVNFATSVYNTFGTNLEITSNNTFKNVSGSDMYLHIHFNARSVTGSINWQGYIKRSGATTQYAYSSNIYCGYVSCDAIVKLANNEDFTCHAIQASGSDKDINNCVLTIYQLP